MEFYRTCSARYKFDAAWTRVLENTRENKNFSWEIMA
jgi:hypothetical protein